MAKSTGLGGIMLVDEFHLSNDIQSYAVNGGPTLIDVTGIDKSGHERLAGLQDGAIQATAFLHTPPVGDVTFADALDLWGAPGHGLRDGDRVQFTAKGTNPSTYSTGTDYWVINATTAAFQLSATRGGAAVAGAGTDSDGTWTLEIKGRAHEALSSLPTTDTIISIGQGTTIGDAAVSTIAKQTNYDPSRAADGSATVDVSATPASGGIVWGHMGTAGVITDTAVGSETGVDGGAASTNGLRAFIHVVEFTGTNATVVIQESSDDGSGDAYATIASFTSITGVGAEAIEITGAVERYLRVAVTVDNFTTMDYAVTVARL
jgi:hypothetical protein